VSVVGGAGGGLDQPLADVDADDVDVDDAGVRDARIRERQPSPHPAARTPL
jgi:hypothetical protein